MWRDSLKYGIMNRDCILPFGHLNEILVENVTYNLPQLQFLRDHSLMSLRISYLVLQDVEGREGRRCQATDPAKDGG